MWLLKYYGVKVLAYKIDFFMCVEQGSVEPSWQIVQRNVMTTIPKPYPPNSHAHTQNSSACSKLIGLLQTVVLSPLLLQTVVNSPQYPTFLADAMKVFLKILEDGEPQFIAEQNMQVRECVCVNIKSEAPENI